jgi:hypothetical protein
MRGRERSRSLQAVRQTSSAPESADSVARAFYRDVLDGWEVVEGGRGDGRVLKFIVAGTLIEVGPGRRRSSNDVAIVVVDPEEVAARCWDAGFHVQVENDDGGATKIAVVDPFGLPIELRPRAPEGRYSSAGAEPA